MTDQPAAWSVESSGAASVAVGGDNYGTISANRFSGAGYEPVDSARIDPSGAAREALLEGFAGRAWLTADFDRFRARHGSGYFVLESAAGLGKTTFAAWLSQQRGYPSHLSQSSNPSTASAVRRSLAAQLIRRWGLDELAPNGMLPPQSIRPDWLHQVLLAAAHRRDRDEPGQPIVLVIDGVDTIRNTDAEAGLGLPSRLPDGMYVLATTRSGPRLNEIWQPFQWAFVRADDRRNIADMREHLTKVTGEPRIRRALTRAGVPADELIGTLLARCAGVWIYLRFVLDEIREGRRRVDDLESLPGDLWTYYALSVEKFRAEERAWESCYLPVLGVLAAAREPVTLELITELCPRARRLPIGRFLERFRPFCHAVQRYGGEAERHQLYHASLRDFLGGAEPDGDARRGGALADELRQAVTDAHLRIADRYLTAWGGLETGLRELARHPAPGLIDGGYGLRNIVRHLHAAGRNSAVHAVLDCVRVSPAADGGTVRQQLWFMIRDHDDDHDGYLADIEYARVLATLAAAADSPGDPAMLGHALRYALILATFNSVASAISGQFVTVLVRSRLWTTQKALAYVRRMPRLTDRARAYLQLLPHVEPAQREELLREALAAAGTAPSGVELAELLYALAPHLPAATIEDEVVPFVRRRTSGGHRIAMLDTLLSALPEARREPVARQLTRQAQATFDVEERLDVLIAVVPFLALPDALVVGEIVRATPSARGRLEMAVALSVRLPDLGERAEISRFAVAAARAAQDTAVATDRLLALSGRVPTEVLAGGAMRLSRERAWSLVTRRAGRDLPAAEVPRLLQAMFLDAGSPTWIATVEAFAPRLDPQTLQDLVTLTAQFHPNVRAQTITALAPSLPPLARAGATLAAADPQTHAVLTYTGDAPPQLVEQLRQTLAMSSAVNDHHVRRQLIAGLHFRSAMTGMPEPRFRNTRDWLPVLVEEMAAVSRHAALFRLDQDAERVVAAGPGAVAAVIDAVKTVGEWFP